MVSFLERKIEVIFLQKYFQSSISCEVTKKKCYVSIM